jgi:hypothetical protein
MTKAANYAHHMIWKEQNGRRLRRLRRLKIKDLLLVHHGLNCRAKTWWFVKAKYFITAQNISRHQKLYSL